MADRAASISRGGGDFSGSGIPRWICAGADDARGAQLGRVDGIDGAADGVARGETKSAAMVDLCMEHNGIGTASKRDDDRGAFNADAAAAFSE